MIALTAEMRAAAARRMGVDDLDPWTVAALVDVLALVERDNDVTPKLPPFEHRIVEGGPWWNHYANEYTAECTCGATFGGTRDKAHEQALDHIEDGAP